MIKREILDGGEVKTITFDKPVLEIAISHSTSNQFEISNDGVTYFFIGTNANVNHIKYLTGQKNFYVRNPNSSSMTITLLVEKESN